MIILIAVVIAVIVSVIASLSFKDDEKISRTIANCLLILGVAIVAYGYCDHRGVFGDPGSLDHKTHYLVLSVTPIDEQSTVVILRGGDDQPVPIKFSTPVTACTNGLYTLVGDHRQDYNLIPVK